MTTWTSSSARLGWVADCGPYIGPWPPAPPIPANVPTGLGVTYHVTTDTLANVVANTDTPSVETSRDSAGNAASAVVADPPITGGDLFVIVNVLDGMGGFTWPTAAPSFDALTVSPALYVSGGVGAAVPNPAGGHWSDWLAFPADLYPVDATAITLQQWTEEVAVPDATDPGYPNIEALLEPSVVGDSGGSATLVTLATGPNPAAVFGIRAAKVGFDGTVVGSDGNGVHRSDWTLPGGTDFTLVDPVWMLNGNPEMAGLIEGVDYARTGALAAEYEGGVTDAFDHWTYVAVDYSTQTFRYDGGGAYPDPVITQPRLYVRFALIDNPLAPPAVPGQVPGAGVTLDQTTVAIVDPDTGSTGSLSLDVSAASRQFYIFVHLILPSSGPIANFDWAGGSQEYSIAWVATVDSAVATAVVTYPRWRYWIPGGTIQWHTAGGHWATPGGAVLKIQTPGAGWVDVVDGLG